MNNQTLTVWLAGIFAVVVMVLRVVSCIEADADRWRHGVSPPNIARTNDVCPTYLDDAGIGHADTSPSVPEHCR